MATADGGDRRTLLDNVVEQRYGAALSTVDGLRAAHPEEPDEQLVNRVIRQCARDLAVGGAMTGGAAASPVAGVTTAAATLGAETAYGVGRLGEMVMAIGILEGFEHRSARQRALWVGAALGLSEGAAVGMTGLAARAGARGGARLLQRLPSAATAAGAGRARRLAGRMAAKGGPWGLAALLPYTIGAGVGAAGNAALALSVGSAARQYFAAQAPHSAGASAHRDHAQRVDDPENEPPEEIWDVEVVEERILDEE